jgi:Tfp pilus assembly protein PilF
VPAPLLASQWPTNATQVPTLGVCRANCPSTGAPQIQGEVRLPDGTPVPNVTVQLSPQASGGSVATAVTDSSGMFDFANVGVGYSYTLQVNVPGYLPVSRSIMTFTMITSADVVLEPQPSGPKPSKHALVSVERLRVPRGAIAQFKRGERQMARGKSRAAEASFRKAIRIFPDFAESYMKLSALYADEGRFAKANRAIQHALRLQKDNSEAYGYLGYVYVKEKHPKKAVQAFHRGIHLDMDNWFAQLELGRLRYSQKQFRRALPHLLLVRQIHPQLLSAHLLLYDDLIRLNRLKEALHELDDFLSRFPHCRQAPQLRKVRAALAASLSRSH